MAGYYVRLRLSGITGNSPASSVFTASMHAGTATGATTYSMTYTSTTTGATYRDYIYKCSTSTTYGNISGSSIYGSSIGAWTVVGNRYASLGSTTASCGTILLMPNRYFRLRLSGITGTSPEYTQFTNSIKCSSGATGTDVGVTYLDTATGSTYRDYFFQCSSTSGMSYGNISGTTISGSAIGSWTVTSTRYASLNYLSGSAGTVILMPNRYMRLRLSGTTATTIAATSFTSYLKSSSASTGTDTSMSYVTTTSGTTYRDYIFMTSSTSGRTYGRITTTTPVGNWIMSGQTGCSLYYATATTSSVSYRLTLIPSFNVLLYPRLYQGTTTKSSSTFNGLSGLTYCLYTGATTAFTSAKQVKTGTFSRGTASSGVYLSGVSSASTIYLFSKIQAGGVEGQSGTTVWSGSTVWSSGSITYGTSYATTSTTSTSVGYPAYAQGYWMYPHYIKLLKYGGQALNNPFQIKTSQKFMFKGVGYLASNNGHNIGTNSGGTLYYSGDCWNNNTCMVSGSCTGFCFYTSASTVGVTAYTPGASYMSNGSWSSTGSVGSMTMWQYGATDSGYITFSSSVSPAHPAKGAVILLGSTGKPGSAITNSDGYFKGGILNTGQTTYARSGPVYHIKTYTTSSPAQVTIDSGHTAAEGGYNRYIFKTSSKNEAFTSTTSEEWCASAQSVYNYMIKALTYHWDANNQSDIAYTQQALSGCLLTSSGVTYVPTRGFIREALEEAIQAGLETGEATEDFMTAMMNGISLDDTFSSLNTHLPRWSFSGLYGDGDNYHLSTNVYFPLYYKMTIRNNGNTTWTTEAIQWSYINGIGVDIDNGCYPDMLFGTSSAHTYGGAITWMVGSSVSIAAGDGVTIYIPCRSLVPWNIYATDPAGDFYNKYMDSSNELSMRITDATYSYSVTSTTAWDSSARVSLENVDLHSGSTINGTAYANNYIGDWITTGGFIPYEGTCVVLTLNDCAVGTNRYSTTLTINGYLNDGSAANVYIYSDSSRSTLIKSGIGTVSATITSTTTSNQTFYYTVSGSGCITKTGSQTVTYSQTTRLNIYLAAEAAKVYPRAALDILYSSTTDYRSMGFKFSYDFTYSNAAIGDSEETSYLYDSSLAGVSDSLIITSTTGFAPYTSGYYGLQIKITTSVASIGTNAWYIKIYPNTNSTASSIVNISWCSTAATVTSYSTSTAPTITNYSGGYIEIKLPASDSYIKSAIQSDASAALTPLRITISK